MHLIMIAIALLIAVFLRGISWEIQANWSQRWYQALFFFLFPPLFLLMTSFAVLCMGTQGQMLGLSASWLSYSLVIGFIGVASLIGVKLAYQGWQTWQQVNTYPTTVLEGKTVRILETDFPYSAQIGFWHPQLVVSQGLLNTLDVTHLEAVLAHEQAHYDYRDTFWFFWLGWLRSFTAWLPNTEYWWQELLLLRELRADRAAAQQVDSLVLAESLLMVVQTPLKSPDNFCATFSDCLSANRLNQRIDAILGDHELPCPFTPWFWGWMLLVFLPWATIPLHY